MIEINDIVEATSEVQSEIERALTADILERYDNPEYWNEDIINIILQNHGYELKGGVL